MKENFISSTLIDTISVLRSYGAIDIVFEDEDFIRITRKLKDNTELTCFFGFSYSLDNLVCTYKVRESFGRKETVLTRLVAGSRAIACFYGDVGEMLMRSLNPRVRRFLYNLKV